MNDIDSLAGNQSYLTSKDNHKQDNHIQDELLIPDWSISSIEVDYISIGWSSTTVKSKIKSQTY